jgi:hypothetical protein
MPLPWVKSPPWSLREREIEELKLPAEGLTSNLGRSHERRDDAVELGALVGQKLALRAHTLLAGALQTNKTHRSERNCIHHANSHN